MNNQLIQKLFLKLQEETPLIHHITNNVTINDCANATLAIGGSPVMAATMAEADEMASQSDALVINFGTINDQMFEAMVIAAKAANHKGIPVIFDPVGVGATKYRTEKAVEFIQTIQVSIIRGNASEVYSLMGKRAKTRGVDTGEIDMTAIDLAKEAAQHFNAIIVISGRLDVIANENSIVQIDNGDVLLTRVTGTGCMTASLIASFAAVADDWYYAAIAGMATMSLAGELAGQKLSDSEGMGTFRIKLMDEISKMNAATWIEGVNLNEA
ncbi:hydroxyethylthiazole kinase [Cytobacillus horneckiae]|uniref:Hydroxyethylthiazole kinase n=1 Tax=Cytobacillus horneckiae TaxID=549687 RepID=A0A2N0ZDY8_9BACI|nr:hydroxyethylthiazole kinase [Cytobacillus horneckiae]MCM3177707.1 hydroxyethylthiazole kinase [Cytobacillus horneckiae]MEC1158022.1 hydroxyethylthiazole kinase [Cytobacillus horneckiae]MED2937053.1 hydroxyethylthiazole kinase [Cytobacillus horneckiae]PKG27718.1 hydroxyethylthiazole kinase [Cytobacillus horneckiae]